MNTEKFEIVAKTFQGLEDVLAEELKNEETQEEPQKIKEKEEGREVSEVTSSNEYEEKRS